MSEQMFKVKAPNPGSWENNDNFNEVLEDLGIEIDEDEFIDVGVVPILKQIHSMKKQHIS